MTSRVSSPRNFRSCGTRPIDANGKISVSSPISVQPSMTADAPTGSSRRCGRSAPIDGVRPDRRPRADLRRGMHDGRRIDLGAVGHQAEQQLGFGHDLIADVRRRLRARERRAPPAERDLEPQPIARHDLAAELRVVDAAQVDARRRAARLRAAAAESPPPATATRASARPA